MLIEYLRKRIKSLIIVTVKVFRFYISYFRAKMVHMKDIEN